MNADLRKVINRLQEHIDSFPVKFLKYPEGELKKSRLLTSGQKKKYLDI